MNPLMPLKQNPSDQSPWLRKLAPPFLLLCLAILFFREIIFKDQVWFDAAALNFYYPWKAFFGSSTFPDILAEDFVRQYLPHQFYLVESLFKDWRFPLWNPLEFTGVPFFATGVKGVIKVSNLLYAFLSFPAALNLQTVLSCFLAGLLIITEQECNLDPLKPPFWERRAPGSQDGNRWQIVLRVQAFKIARYEVTNRSYRKFVDSTNRALSAYDSDARFNHRENPVVGVSWEDGRDYCRWVGGRLPAEAEWLKAGRGKDNRQTSWGWNQIINYNVLDRANINPVVSLKLYDWYGSRFAADGYRFTAPVGSFPKGVSPYGVHDLIGNVWEWVDRRLPHPMLKSRRRVPPRMKPLKGGSWMSLENYLSLGTRRWRDQSLRQDSTQDSTVGFRCARDS